jgi:DNA-binding HxlR family transcriptional regulator
MSVKAIGWAFEQKLDDPLAKLVLLALADHYNESTGDAWPSIDRLVTITEGSRSTVIRKLKKLEQVGFISREKRYNKTDVYRIHFTGVTETPQINSNGVTLTPQTESTGVTETPLEVSQRHTNTYRTLNINNNSKTSSKQKVSDWTPTEDDLAYATELGLDANEVLTDIRLWDEKNGNRAAYNSVTAFWQGWCRKESKRRPARSVSQQKPNYAERGLSEAQLGFIDSLTRKYYGKFKHESYDWDMLHGWITEMVLNRYDFNQWVAMGHGLPHHTEL